MGISPSRRLRIEAFYSLTANEPKLHLDPTCKGLERVVVHPEEYNALGIMEFPTMRSLASVQGMRPCRVCALEPVLKEALRPASVREVMIFTTFTSHPAYDADPRRFTAKKVSDSGRERLERVAEHLGLPVVSTSIGPAAYGFLPRPGAKVLAANLRTQVNRKITEMPSPEFIQTFWTFVDDAPPELVGSTGRLDPWEIAAMITAAP